MNKERNDQNMKEEEKIEQRGMKTKADEKTENAKPHVQDKDNATIWRKRLDGQRSARQAARDAT